LIEQLIQVSLLAGDIILKYYRSDLSVDTCRKSDESPLTRADVDANKIITNHLQLNFPGIPVLSEESSLENFEKRKDWKELFIVDPLDGTKEFIKKNDEFTVNIAYVQGGDPKLGVVYAPALNLMYYSDGSKAFIVSDGHTSILNVTRSKRGIVRIVTSRSHLNSDTKKFVSKFENVDFLTMGSSLKLCLIAEGKADLYPRFAPTSEWDIAAGHAVLKAAGGDILNALDHRPIKYNKANILNPTFIAFGDEGYIKKI